MRIHFLLFLVLLLSIATMNVDAYFFENEDICYNKGGHCALFCVTTSRIGACTLTPSCCK
ncbi:hypothetical protein GDO86_020194 [Hymenochirus boettgeri]|uniref:Beta-defensin n=1 Tax=Hymenochirus boettgeri TaxID=247094 RepID=A0A8T2IIW1_9PIPI|nr:hypothetical protein GDO86_020194 [Hymenochirus boettgeri]